MPRLSFFFALGLAAVLFIGAVPLRLGQLAALAPEAVPLGWSRAGWLAALNGLGLNGTFYAPYQAALEIILAAGMALAATVIAQRERLRGHPRTPTSLLAAVGLLLTGLALLPVLAALPPSLHDLVRGLRAAAWIALVALLLLFPDGRFEPRWAVWLLLAWVAYQLSALVVPALAPPLFVRHLDSLAEALIVAGHAAVLLAGGLFQYRRLTRAAEPAQRQQSKWLLFGALAAGLGGLLLLLPQWLLPLERAPGLLGIVVTLFSAPALAILLLFWPVSFALAATRTA